MIYFSRKPDDVFSTILHESFDMAAKVLRKASEEEYRGVMPNVASWCTAKRVVREIAWLQGISTSDVAYRIGVHHWAIVHDSLALFCALHQALLDEAPVGSPLRPIGAYELGVIDFELMVDSFFWNLDCREIGVTPPVDARRAERVEGQRWVDMPNALFRPGSTRYPDPDTPSDTRTRRDGPVVSIPLDDEIAVGLKDQRQRFIEKFGREPGENDPIFFDPESPTLKPIDTEKVQRDMVNAMRKAGIAPDRIYAFEKTGMLPLEGNLDVWSKKDLDEWQAAIEEFRRLHRRRGRSKRS